jgi:glycosyltransferase involved in cell wall biosynthesis
MKLLTYTSLFPNCAQPFHGVFVYQRMVHFARRPQNKVVVVSPMPWVPTWLSAPKYSFVRAVPDQEEIGGITVFHPRYLLIPKISMALHGLLMFLGSHRLVQKLQQDNKFDAVDSHYVYPDGLAAALLARLVNLPLFVSARGTDMNLFPRFRLIRPMIRWTLRNAVGGIGVCKPLRDAMVEMGLPPALATVIGNGVDLHRFKPVSRSSARQQLGMRQDAIILVAIGALIPRKGLHFLIPAFARTARANHYLYIVGEGDQRRELQALAEQHNVSDRIFMIGVRPNEELNLWFSAANLSCLVSSREGWPNVLLESMACGTPVLATRVWGVPEVVVSSNLGILVDQNVDSIVKGLQDGLERQWDRELLIEHARSRTWDIVAEELEQYMFQRLESD